MSNETFKSVRSVDDQFSELNVSGNAVIHDRLLVNDLVATSIVHAPVGKTLKQKELSGVLAGVVPVEVSWVHPALQIVAAELESDATVQVSVGNASGGRQIFNGASAPSRVSSVYSQTLGSSGVPNKVSVAQNGSLWIAGSGASTDSVSLKVYYYED